MKLSQTANSRAAPLTQSSNPILVFSDGGGWVLTLASNWRVWWCFVVKGGTIGFVLEVGFCQWMGLVLEFERRFVVELMVENVVCWFRLCVMESGWERGVLWWFRERETASFGTEFWIFQWFCWIARGAWWCCWGRSIGELGLCWVAGKWWKREKKNYSNFFLREDFFFF